MIKKHLIQKCSISFIVFAVFGNAVASQNIHDTSKWTMHIFGKDTLYYAKEKPYSKAIKNGEYRMAISLLRQALKEDSCDANDNYNLACMYSKTGKHDSACYFLSISQQIRPSVSFLLDPDFYPIIQRPGWKKLKADYLDLIRKYGLGVRNIALATDLWQMQQTDQLYYKELHLAEQKWGQKSSQVDSIWALKNEINEHNLKRLEEIVKEGGWPKISEAGTKAAGAAFLVIQHADLETQKKYESVIEGAANKGEASWSDLALLVDRLLVKQNKPQIYGSQLRFNEQKKCYEPSPVQDEHNLDIRRKKVGLEPAADYYKYWNITYTVSQNTE